MSTATNVSLSLVKDQKMDITKTNPGLTEVEVCAGWDTDLDVDLFIIQLGADGKLLYPLTNGSNSTDTEILRSIVYFKNKVSRDGAIELDKDTRDSGGNAAGLPDETCKINFAKLDPNCKSLGCFVNIYNPAPNQLFGSVKDAFILIRDASDKKEIGRYDLAEEASNATGFCMGKLYDYNGEWKFQAASMPVNGDILTIAKQFI